MLRRSSFRLFSLLLPIAVLVLSSCAPLIQPVIAQEPPATPVVTLDTRGVDNPNVFADPATFQATLLQALATGDTEKLQRWMSDPFLTGTWRYSQSDVSPAEALKALYATQLGTENHLEAVVDADLKELMSSKDPLSIPNGEMGVPEAFLVSGWGKDGRDEAILYIAHQADDSLKWQGWIQIQGGFSGARLGCIRPYQNDANSYSLFLPKDDQAIESNATEVLVLAPGQGHPGEGRAAAFIFIEPANGRSVEQVVEAVNAEYPSGFNITVDPPINMDDVKALVVNGLPGQDSNRQLFMVHNDLLYHITFVPDNPQLGDAYQQMEDIYAMIVNTFHFTD
jgi:hypothetical protein